MRVTIISDDIAVYVNGEALNVDLTGLDPTIHAVQWYGDLTPPVGDVEFKYDPETRSQLPNQRITDLSPFQPFVDRWNVAKAALPSTQATPPSTTPVSTAVNVISS